MDIFNQGWQPSILQYIDGFYSLHTYNYPPSFTFWFLIAKNREGSWHDLNLYIPLPHGSGCHCWLDPPVWSHWTTLAPLFVFSPAISTHWWLKTDLIKTPFPCFWKCHLWFHLLLIYHVINLYPCFLVLPGTSKDFPEKLLIITALLLRVWFPPTLSILNSWFSEFGSKSLTLRIPYKPKALFPFLESVLIQ